MAEIMYWEAIQRAHDEEMARDPLVICMGEDIGVAGGTYKATKGLYEKYGPLRVIDTPISENGHRRFVPGRAPDHRTDVGELRLARAGSNL